MSQFKYVLYSDFLDYTATGSSEATDHPDGNVGETALKAYCKAPYRTWRSTVVTATTFILNFGSDQTVEALYLGNCNFTSVAIEKSPTSGYPSWSSVDASEAVGIDYRTGRYKLFYEIPVAHQTAGAYRITLSSVVGGAAYYEIGSIVAADVVNTFDDYMTSQLQYTVKQAHTVVEFSGGGHEINEDGEPYLEYVIDNPLYKRASGGSPDVLQQLRQLASGGIGSPILLYENMAETDKAYILGRVEEMAFTEVYATFSVPMRFREFV